MLLGHRKQYEVPHNATIILYVITSFKLLSIYISKQLVAEINDTLNSSYWPMPACFSPTFPPSLIYKHNSDVCGRVNSQLGIPSNSNEGLYSFHRSSGMIAPIPDGSNCIFPIWVESSANVCVFLSSMSMQVFWSKTSLCLVLRSQVARTDSLSSRRHFVHY